MSESTLTVTLYEQEVRFILEALEALQSKWLEKNRTTDDEDEQAEYGMDAAVLDITRERLNAAAIEVFGAGIRNFLHEKALPSLEDSAESPDRP